MNNFPSFRKQIDPQADCQYVTVSRPGENKLPYYFRKMSGDFVCNVCGKQFGAKKTLSQHNWAVQTEFESNCTHCDKTFRSKKKLTYHMRSTHAENKVFHCELKFGDIQCSYYSTSNSNLRVHVKRVHEKAGNKAANAHFFVVRVTTERI